MTAAIDALLDGFHRAAAVADRAAYFGSMTDDFVFLGTDATERWERAAFEAFAAPYFERDSAWVYRSVERHVVVRGEVGWFDERLENPTYGEARGSGVVVREAGVWRVAQYVLSFPIPNELALEVMGRVRERASD